VVLVLLLKDGKLSMDVTSGILLVEVVLTVVVDVGSDGDLDNKVNVAIPFVAVVVVANVAGDLV
jgi:hypothetical protein